MVKVDVDIKRNILAIGGEWHSEGVEILSKDGSSREDVWGINFHPYKSSQKRIEYESLINIKPAFNHPKIKIQDKEIQSSINSVVMKLLLDDNESLN